MWCDGIYCILKLLIKLSHILKRFLNNASRWCIISTESLQDRKWVFSVMHWRFERKKYRSSDSLSFPRVTYIYFPKMSIRYWKEVLKILLPNVTMPHIILREYFSYKAQLKNAKFCEWIKYRIVKKNKINWT